MGDELTKPDYTRQEVVNAIRQTVAKGATDAQLLMFIQVCKRTGLDPFLKEIWFSPEGGVMAGRDGYLRVANEHPQFDGMETHVERDEHAQPIKAICSVWRKDRKHPVVCEAYFNEYNKPNSNVWRRYPSAMIAKVAEVMALKRSFSINGVVSEEEIGQQPPEPNVETWPVPGKKPWELPMESMKRKLPWGKYYEVLKGFGYAHANEIPDIETARTVYAAMVQVLKTPPEGEPAPAPMPVPAPQPCVMLSSFGEQRQKFLDMAAEIKGLNVAKAQAWLADSRFATIEQAFAVLEKELLDSLPEEEKDGGKIEN